MRMVELMVEGQDGIVYGPHVQAQMKTWVEFQDPDDKYLDMNNARPVCVILHFMYLQRGRS